ncbi:Protein of unknown function [Mariniphaga anaerophila]|uniref:Outer membrane protein beta-barrel domain-containing protein n=1 Tax=Mariniphaga anaerophila TaxID=1484053 RepID=A0A1M4W8K9_9BACT|nr:DUF3575 domain-containing protein [Mariniphaga anaerophila]SHE77433.1 Protein of unknown function [Mariniphaga anaerophila]
MERILTLLIISASFLFGKAQAQQDKNATGSSVFSNVIKVGVAPGGIEYEYRTGNKTSVNLAIHYSYAGLANPDNYNLQITPEFRYYFSKNKKWAEGFYLGGYLFYKDYRVARDMESGSSSVYSRDDVKTAGVGLKPGYQFVLDKRITFDFGLGLGYNLYCDVTHKEGEEIINESTHHLNFTGGMTIGFLF